MIFKRSSYHDGYRHGKNGLRLIPQMKSPTPANDDTSINKLSKGKDCKNAKTL